MPDIDMYKEQILDLFKNPINVGPLSGATHRGHKHNPSCGDEFTIELLVKDDVIIDAAFVGSGCAISTASSCLLTDALKGKTVGEARALSGEAVVKLLGVPVSAARVNCATLSLDCLRIALSSSPHDYKYLPQVISYINSLFKEKSSDEIVHFEQAVHWLRSLNPSVGEAALIAAYSHDVERAFRTKDVLAGKRFTDEDHLKYHQDEGARIIGEFLVSVNAPSDLVSDVKHLVSRHEWGGDALQDLICDADSLSFLETKIDAFLSKVATKGFVTIKEKFDWMYERMRTTKGKELARPLYESAIRKLVGAGK